MSPLILCGALISLVVSANAVNNSQSLEVSTTLLTLPSRAIHTHKNCVLLKKKSEILEIVELLKSDRIHVVDIRIVFSRNGSYKLNLADVKVSDPIGQEILYTLQQWRFKYVTWTLNAGIRHFELNVEESPNDCIDELTDVADFASKNILDIVRSMNLTTHYKVWYSFNKLEQICCPTATYNMPKCSHELCSKDNSLLYESYVLWDIAAVLMMFGLFWGGVSLLSVFLSRTKFGIKYPEYYKLKESMMSMISIFFTIVWEERDRKASFIRSFLLRGVFLYFIYLQFGPIRFFDTHILLFLFSGLFFSIPYLFKPKITKSLILGEIEEECEPSCVFSITQRFVDNISVLHVVSDLGYGQSPYFDLIKDITKPFNLKFWEKIPFFDFLTSSLRTRGSNRIFCRFFKFLTLFFCYVFEIVFWSVFLCIAIAFYAFFVIPCVPVLYVFNLIFLAGSLKYSYIEFCSNFWSILGLIDLMSLCTFFIFSFFVMTFGTQSFVLGLFLNLTYFIPYFAFLAVLLFYCGSYWKSMEEKYLVLKRLIYEECQDVQDVNNGCIPNRHLKKKEYYPWFPKFFMIKSGKYCYHTIRTCFILD